MRSSYQGICKCGILSVGVRKRAEGNGSFCMSDQWFLINEDSEV